MSDESSHAPSDHSDASFDIVPDDASSDQALHVPSPNGMDRVVDKLLDVLSGMTEALAQNQAVLSSMAQLMEAVFKDKRQNEKQLEALTKDNDARDRRMAQLSEELDRKCTAVISLDKAVEDAHHEIHLLKESEQEKDRQMAEMSTEIQEHEELQATTNRGLVREIESLEKAAQAAHDEIRLLNDHEQEKDRQMAAMSKKIQELEELQVADHRDISELEAIVDRERDKVVALEKLVDAQDEELEDLTQKVQELKTSQKKSTHEKGRDVAGYAPALYSEVVSNKLKPGAESTQHATCSQWVGQPTMDTEDVLWSSQSTLNAFCAKKQVGAKHLKKIAPTVCGRTVSLRAYNGYFLYGNYGDTPATFDGTSADGDSVRFTVENAGNGEVALKSCGKYLTIIGDGSAVKCCRHSRNKWCHFDWVEHDSGEVSLRGANGKYVSSDYEEFVTCNRDEVGPQERFTVV